MVRKKSTNLKKKDKMNTKLIILRTNIKTRKKLKTIVPVLDNHTSIHQWSIDIEDIDNVLRVQTNEDLQEKDVIQLVREHGFYAEDLEG